MKRFILQLIPAILALTLSAQDNPSFVSLMSGPSFPVGKFHNKELPDGGFAKLGVNASLEGAWFFKPWAGIGANTSFNLHPVDVGSLGYEKVNADPFMNDITIRSDPYLSLSVYAGLYFNVPLVQRLSFTAKALGGIIYAQTPYQLNKADYFIIGKDWYEITSAGDIDGSFLAGAGLRYDLNGCIGFALNSDFTYNVMDFNFISALGTRTDKKVMSYVTVLAGLVVKI